MAADFYYCMKSHPIFQSVLWLVQCVFKWCHHPVSYYLLVLDKCFPFLFCVCLKNEHTEGTHETFSLVIYKNVYVVLEETAACVNMQDDMTYHQVIISNSAVLSSPLPPPWLQCNSDKQFIPVTDHCCVNMQHFWWQAWHVCQPSVSHRQMTFLGNLFVECLV